MDETKKYIRCGIKHFVTKLNLILNYYVDDGVFQKRCFVDSE